MPTQRPFLSNFLAAFRAHSQQIPKASPQISTSAAVASSATIWTSATPSQKAQSPTPEHATTSPRPINAKVPYAGTSQSSDRQLQHLVSPSTHLPRSPSSTGLPVYGPPNKPSPSYPTCQEARRARRGSASSSDSGGFREVRTGEKWFIAGRTAGGEEKYYKLGMVKRDRSADRISADQLSL